MTVELRDSATSGELAAITAGLPVKWEEVEGLRHHAEFNRAEVPGAEVIKRLVNECHVLDLHMAEQGIDEVVRDIYRQTGQETS